MTAATPGQAMAAPEDKTSPEYQLLGWAASIIADAPGMQAGEWETATLNWLSAYAALTASPAAREPHAAAGPAGCECGHAQTGHAFSDDVCAVPDCPCPGYRHTPQPAPGLAALRQAAARELVTAADRDQLSAELGKLKQLLDDFTHAVIDLDDGARLVGIDKPAKAAHAVREKAGLPVIDQFSHPAGPPA